MVLLKKSRGNDKKVPMFFEKHRDFFIISSGLFQKHHREVLLGMSLFRWKLQLEFIANGQLEHIGITIAMLRHLGDTYVVAGIQDDVLELV